MSLKYFKDGVIRGKTNNGTMNPIMVVKMAQAIGTVFGDRNTDEPHIALLCKDTRRSNYMFEPCMQGGLTSVGMDVQLTGPLPTPAAAWLTRSARASVGIVLTAGHHPFHDNGITLFGPDGSGPTEAQQLEIERLIDLENREKLLVKSDERGGEAWRIDDAQGQYVTHVKSMLPMTVRFGGMRAILDCAHGASYKVAPRILRELGAEIFTIGANPSGLNINEECGVAHPQAVIKEVKKYRADLGIALDGDGGQVVMVDEQGRLIDGDRMRSIIANFRKEDAPPANPANDGFVTALQVMSAIQAHKQKASEVFHD
ncbi:MAG TPA: hypothetical protein VN665_01380 [Candidatus Paceibacterota bacterium]|nr:hypothetical protein [Candidatus Paceibacterota bacterium]